MKIEIELRSQDAWLKRKTEADIESGDINNIVRKLLMQHYHGERKVKYVTDMDGTRTPYMEP